MIKAESLTSTVTEKGYTILLDGVPWIIQEGYIPYKGKTMAESAQNHIDAILADQAKAEEKQPSETDILGQQIAALTLSSGQKDIAIQQLGAQVVKTQLEVSTMKGDAS